MLHKFFYTICMLFFSVLVSPEEVRLDLSTDLDEILKTWPLKLENLVINSNDVNIRSGPGIDQSIIGRLSTNTIVEFVSQHEAIVSIAGTSGRWLKIKTSNLVGYVFSAFCNFYIGEYNNHYLTVSFYPDLYGFWKPVAILYNNAKLKIEHKWTAQLAISTKSINQDLTLINVKEYFESLRSNIHNIYFLNKGKLHFLTTLNASISPINGIVNKFLINIDAADSYNEITVEHISSLFTEWELTDHGIKEVNDYP